MVFGATGSGRMGAKFCGHQSGAHNMPPLMLAGLRFMLVAFPASFLLHDRKYH